MIAASLRDGVLARLGGARAPRTSGTRIALLLVLLVALGLRLYGVRFGLPALNDPDELVFELGAYHMVSNGTLNPGWFGHPATTTMYLLAAIDGLVFVAGWLGGVFVSPKAFANAIYLDPSWVIVPGRLLVVAFAVGVVGLTARLGNKLADWRVGLAAAALVAIAPVHIQWSQVVRADIMASAFMLLAMMSALCFARQGTMRAALAGAAWTALAVASKWPFAVVSLAFAGAAALRFIEEPSRRAETFRRLAIYGLSAPLMLVAISPYLLLDWRKALHDLGGEAQVAHLGATGGSPLWNAWWYLSHPLYASLGAVGCALLAVGVWRTVREREMLAIVWSVIIPFALLFMSQHIVWDRWALPLIPLCAILASMGGLHLLDSVTERTGIRDGVLAGTGLALAVALPLVSADFAQARERMTDTRQLATQWLVRHASPGSRVLVEHFAFDLVGSPYTLLFPAAGAGCLDVVATLHGQVSLGAIEGMRRGHAIVDYGSVASDKLDTCRADYAIFSQFDRYAAERDRFPEQYSQYRRALEHARPLVTFRPVPGDIGGPIVRVVALGN